MTCPTNARRWYGRVGDRCVDEDLAWCGCQCNRRGDRCVEDVALIRPGSDARIAVATALVDFHRVAICYDKLAALLPVLALATAVRLSPSINPRSDFRHAYAARH